MQISRRSLLGSLGALIVAPAIVRASSLMSIRPFDSPSPDLADIDAFLKVHWDAHRIRPTRILTGDDSGVVSVLYSLPSVWS